MFSRFLKFLWIYKHSKICYELKVVKRVRFSDEEKKSF